jgi:tetratricopeptide (TPR) repeat protein
MTEQLRFRSFWLKLDKVFGMLVVAAVFCLIFITAHRAIFDPDIWLHLKTGEFILQQKSIPSADIFSFTRAGMPWNDHEWLFQVGTSLIYNKWQADGLILLECYVIALTFLILLLMGIKTIGSYLEAGIFLFLAAYASITRFNIRPDIFSLFFLSIYLYILRFRIDKRIIYLLLPLQILWVNFHGYFFLGPLVIFFFIAAEFLRRKIKLLPGNWKNEFALDDTVYRRLKTVFLCSLAVNIFNPQWLRGAVYPVQILKGLIFGENQIFFKHIQELQPTFKINSYSSNFYLAIIFLVLFLMAVNFKRLKIIEIILGGFFFLFALTARNMVFFTLVGYLIIVSYFGTTLNRVPSKIKLQKPWKEAFYFMIKYAVSIFFITWIVLRIDNNAGNGYYDFEKNKFVRLLSGEEERDFPKKAVDFILENNISGNLFNDFNSGAYLIGRVFPERKVFIDGRTELYGKDFFQQYQSAMSGNAKDFDAIMDRYNISGILMSLTSERPYNIINLACKVKGWKVVFLDAAGLVILKELPVNSEVIAKYAFDPGKYKTPLPDLQSLGLRRVYPLPYIKRACVFDLLEEDRLVIEECRQALRVMPDCGRAFHILGKVYLRQGLHKEALENLRSAVLFMPANVEALTDLGATLKELKDYRSAMYALNGAIERSRHYAAAYYELGCVYALIGKKAKAAALLRQAEKLNTKPDAELEKNIQARLKEIN